MCLFSDFCVFCSFDIVFLGAVPGLPRRLRATNLLWKGKTQSAINLLQDDVLVADPGTKYDFFSCVDFLISSVCQYTIILCKPG